MDSLERKQENYRRYRNKMAKKLHENRGSYGVKKQVVKTKYKRKKILVTEVEDYLDEK